MNIIKKLTILVLTLTPIVIAGCQDSNDQKQSDHEDNSRDRNFPKKQTSPLTREIVDYSINDKAVTSSQLIYDNLLNINIINHSDTSTDHIYDNHYFVENGVIQTGGCSFSNFFESIDMSLGRPIVSIDENYQFNTDDFTCLNCHELNTSTQKEDTFIVPSLFIFDQKGVVSANRRNFPDLYFGV